MTDWRTLTPDAITHLGYSDEEEFLADALELAAEIDDAGEDEDDETTARDELLDSIVSRYGFAQELGWDRQTLAAWIALHEPRIHAAAQENELLSELLADALDDYLTSEEGADIQP